MTLTAGCAAVDKGAVLPNVNDTDFSGAAPDLGAYERGRAVPVYGPRVAPTATISVLPSTIVAGGSATLSWSTTDASTVYIDGVGGVPPTGSAAVSPFTTTTYTLTATGASGVATASTTLNVSAGGSTAFGGTPVSLPGTIEAERFDEGGPEVAYHDGTAGNSGGAFRTTDVDIEGTSDAGGGYDVGWVGAGEWLNYSVSVTAAGSYTMGVRVAATSSGGTFHIESGSANLTGPLTIPNTGGWQTWTTVTKNVTLTAGTQTLRLVMDAAGANGAVGNFNWIAVTHAGSIAFGGTPVSLPGTIEVERFDEGGAEVAYHDDSAGNSGGAFRTTDVDIEGTSDAGGGYDVGWVSAGEWLNYSVSVTAAGSYAMAVRVAATSNRRDLPYRKRRRQPDRSAHHPEQRRMADMDHGDEERDAHCGHADSATCHGRRRRERRRGQLQLDRRHTRRVDTLRRHAGVAAGDDRGRTVRRGSAQKSRITTARRGTAAARSGPPTLISKARPTPAAGTTSAGSAPASG